MSNGLGTLSVASRQEMARLLDERMNRTYSALSELQELEPDTSLVKTFLLEAHNPEAEVDQAEDILQASVEGLDHDWVEAVHFERANERGLATLEVLCREEHVPLYIDYSHPRFWQIHSTASSRNLDWLLNRFLSLGSGLDTTWIPAQLLEAVSSLGPFRGLNLDYDRSEIPDVDFDGPDAPVEKLKMQLWGSTAGSVLDLLRGPNGLPSATTLSKIKVKYWHTEDEDIFTLDDIRYDGKLTARGTSFESHTALTSILYDQYRDIVTRLEDEFSLNWPDNGQGEASGEPITLNLSRPIADLDKFCESVFSSSKPFRLWGVPLRVSDQLYSVRAVDLHVGDPINFEIGQDWIRIYLPEGSCGNTVLRVFTNLQHHYDALVQAHDGVGDNVVEF